MPPSGLGGVCRGACTQSIFLQLFPVFLVICLRHFGTAARKADFDLSSLYSNSLMVACCWYAAKTSEKRIERLLSHLCLQLNYYIIIKLIARFLINRSIVGRSRMIFKNLASMYSFHANFLSGMIPSYLLYAFSSSHCPPGQNFLKILCLYVMSPSKETYFLN